MKRLMMIVGCVAFMGAAQAQSVSITCAWAVPNDTNADKSRFQFFCTNFANQSSFRDGPKKAEYEAACLQQLNQATASCGPTDKECIKQGYRQAEAPMKAKCVELSKR